jgi:hypothetical protein
VSKLATPSVDLPADVKLLMRFMRSSARVLYTKVKSNECTIFFSTPRLHSTCLEDMGGVFKQTLRKHANRHSAYHGSALSSNGTNIVESITPCNCSLCYTSMFFSVLLEFTNRKYSPARGKQILSCGKLNC